MKFIKLWYFISPWLLQQLIWVPTRLLLIFCGHIEIKGLENLKKVPHNAIFACNHSSEMDVFLIPGSFPFFSRFSPMFYTSREQSFYQRAGWRQQFYGGVFFNCWGAYAVKVGLNDYAKSLASHIGIIREGGSLCIFPEGRTTQDGNLQPGKGGVAYLSYVTGRPIVPVRLGGTFRLSPKDFFLGRRRLSVSFGEPMYATSRIGVGVEPTFEEFKANAQIVMEKIKALPTVPVPVNIPAPASHPTSSPISSPVRPSPIRARKARVA
ncbi:MAG: lysophospholipid acyltransferase family protein [Candidatus Taylorbacteria bacterium]|nr:lysophospholipid acyltransferase family protein [Candidatus Taylorbacteria bacterium]